MRPFPSLKQPPGSISCGAYCLTAALVALECLPQRQPISVSGFNFDTKDFSGPEKRLEGYKTDCPECQNGFCNSVYDITGILPKKLHSEEFMTKGMNSLVASYHVLLAFGCDSKLIFRDSHTLEKLSGYYPQEAKLSAKLGITPSVNIEDTQLTDDEILLCSILINGYNHRIAMNPQGLWFDPASGQGDLEYDPITTWDHPGAKKPPATWNGVALKITKRENPHSAPGPIVSPRAI